ncbi:hypothetical protein BH11CYA1_BH11CYA1_05910 [soil metagenome]
MSKPAFPVALSLFALVNLALYGLFQSSKLTGEKTLDNQSVRQANYEARQEGPWIWWVTRSFLAKKQSPDLVLLGSSQMGSAIFSAEAEHRKAALDTTDQREVTRLGDALKNLTGKQPEVFNLAMGGAMVSDHYLLARTLFKGAQKPKAVIIGVNPRDFLDNTLPSASSTDAFYFLSPYVNVSNLAPVSFPGPFNLLDYRLKEWLPLKQVTTILKGSEPPSLANVPTFTNPEAKGVLEPQTKTTKNGSAVNTQVLQAISGSAGDVRQGQWRVPAEPPYLFIDNTREYLRRYKNPNPPCLAGQKAYFHALLTFLKDENIKVVVVGMPSLQSNRDILPASFWSQFKSYLQTEAVASGGTFVDLFGDKRFGSHDFLDTVHLNRWGGGTLISVLAQELAKRSEITAVLGNQTTSSNRAIGARSQKQWQ